MKIKHRLELSELMPKRKLTGVEVGVAGGAFSNDMLMNWKIKTLYLVDVWKCIPTQKGDASSPQAWHDFTFETCRRIMANHNKKAIIMQGFSVDMALKIKDKSLDFVYLDADHSYEGVMSDLEAWFPKLKKGGIMFGHDYLNEAYGVNIAVEDYRERMIYTPILIPEHDPGSAGFYFIKH